MAVYAAFFLSGGTALIFEILWSRQFVTVFGASTYAVSVVLCAFMAGLGVGGWLGGQLAGRFEQRLLMYGAAQAGVALWAACIPLLLGALGRWAPRIALLAPESPLLSVAGRFLISFAILFVPCALMGTTLPLLVRFCAESERVIGARVSLLYGVNTLGATAGCFAAGYWLADTFGLRATNLVAVGINLLIGAGAVALALRTRQPAEPLLARAAPAAVGTRPDGPAAAEGGGNAARGTGRLLLAVAFISGLAGLSCEVLWLRYIGPLSNMAYTFTTVLGMYLLGVGVGSLICNFLLARLGHPLRMLSAALLLLGMAVLASFTAGALISGSREAGPLPLWPMSAVTVVAPTVLMGIAFPLICAAYARSVATVGRSIGAVYAVNTAGTIIGSLLPVFVLIPVLGIQRSVLVASLLYCAAGAALLWAMPRRRFVPLAATGAAALAGVLLFAFVVPPDLCQKVILSTSTLLRRTRDTAFYREGKTSTEAVTRDKINGLKYLYMNGSIEVTTAFPEMLSFKMMGGLGPLLHPNPKDVLMVCFGGGVASGAAAQYPEVSSVLAIDIESSVLAGARAMEPENNAVLDNPKLRVVIDDGRNYLLMSRRKWPVIVSDSLHPKSSDSWVLYTREFYQTVKDRLTDDGIYIQWVPFQGLSVAEYKSIARTFQSVFPHASLWFAHGVAETGAYKPQTLLLATPARLSVDVASLKRKLSAPQVAADLRPWGFDTPAGVLETFVCGEDRLSQWAAEAPINTDDLPYVQYKTKYSGGPECTAASFAPLLESAWPYLRNAGEEAEAVQLERELDLHLQANRLTFTGRIREAIALLPEDVKFRKSRENLALGARWIDGAARLCGDSSVALASLAARAMAIPDNWSQTIALYERAVALELDNASAQKNLGFALASAERWDEAIEHYEIASHLEPRNAVTHSNLGVALAGKGSLDQAIVELEEALRLDPSLASTQCTLGILLERQGKLEEAARHFAEALRITPDLAAAKEGLDRVRGLSQQE